MIDLYSVKPVDADAILTAAGETKALVTVEDHWPEGGIGETVAGVLAEAGAGTPLVRLAVTGALAAAHRRPSRGRRNRCREHRRRGRRSALAALGIASIR